jgi:predicted metal-binding membrane protein
LPLRELRRYPGIALALLGVAALAWWLTVNRMAGMDAGPGAELGTFSWFAVTWLVMMAAMMLPSFAPSVARYLSLSPARPAGRWVPFSAGYLATWTAAGIAAYGVFEIGREVSGGDLAWRAGGRWLAGGILIAAAVYELVPLKQACLERCRGQLEDGAQSRGGWVDSVAKGVRSGGWCIGCSWLLMAALFALGVMSLTWMGVVATLVALEKLGPWPFATRLVVAAVVAALAVGMIVAPHDIPGLVVPHPGAANAMGSSGLLAPRSKGVPGTASMWPNLLAAVTGSR